LDDKIPATDTITINAGAKDESAREVPSRPKRTAADPYTVLVVDDEESVRKFVERVLREGGYRTAIAGDGTEALEVASKLGPFEILVTDVMMPRMSGDELARRLRQTDPGLKILYLTGFSDRLFKEKVTLWEDEAFLDKPCSVAGLLEAVSLLLFGHFKAPTAT
jgi:two-component system, cell cycle sensor histidine kinase and response regulator CckA